ncbi:MAG: bifunctional diaminohydroxyphosphoribosylaminopyrimidine deaminase/5-amino-6-(5-phosphoribosylamino)uracil reductase RibD [bacterium]
MSTQIDHKFMREALRLAESTRGRTSPDPMVGAVIVKGNKIISKGYHGEFTTPHAETYAIHKAGKKAKGATLYVNLEPCCHWGNNPPCTMAIIRSGIKRVVVGTKDPNPLVSGKGIKELRQAGIKVDIGILEEKAIKLNEAFNKHIITGIPFITVKYAMSIDGKIATSTGESKYISNAESRIRVHKIRSQNDAIMVGVNTVIKDDPSLTVRLPGKKIKNQPIRIVLDSMARTPIRSNILSKKDSRTIIVVSSKAPINKVKNLEKAGGQVLIGKKGKKGRVSMLNLVKELGQRGIISIMIEGGGETNAAAIEADIVDKIICFITPKIIGGRYSKTPVEGIGIKSLKNMIQLDHVKIERINHDTYIEGYIRKQEN